MICAHCGAANGEGARFCGVCGSAMSLTEPVSNPSLGDGPELAMIGREIAGRYRMLAKLGEGGMGTVFRAEQISLKRTVAVKLLRPDVVGSQMLLRRFNAEAEAVAKLNHPNTVNIYDFGQDTDGTLFIAMEYIEGRSLRRVIQSDAPLAPRRALAIAQQVAASLADAHAHAIVHRDLKPDNVMLQDRGRERDIARVLDFGIAKLRDDTRATQMQMTQAGDMLGTPQYMAPEQIRAEAIDGRTDIYALGCMLYEMVTGRLPYEASTVLALLSKHLLEQPLPPSQRRPELPLSAELDALILGAMAKDPAARPPTMDAFGEQIAALWAAQPADPRSAQRSAAAPAMAVPHPSTGGGTGGGPYVGTPPPYQPPSQPPPVQPYQPPVPPYQPPPASAIAPPAHAPQIAIPPPPRRRAAVVALAGIVLVGAAVTGLVLAMRSHPSAATPADASDELPADASSSWDPWAGASSASANEGAPSAPDALDGDRVEIGQGVEIVVPPGFETTVQNGVTIARDEQGTLIAAGPIAIATDDPKQLARYHAKVNGLVFDKLQQDFVAGAQRPVAVFHGKVGGVLVAHIAVPLIGPGYRVFVALQAPAQRFMTDKTLQALALELFARRIVVP